MDTTHIMMQSKGATGKSLIASFLAEYFHEKYGDLNIMSTGFSRGSLHSTLEKYKALNVIRIQHDLKRNQINQAKFDDIFNFILTDSGISVDRRSVIVDINSNDFISFNGYAIDLRIEEVYSEYNKQLIIHCPIVYGRSKDETTDCLLQILKDYPATPVVIWENEFFGKSKNSFIHQDLFNSPNNIIGMVRIGDISSDIEKDAFSKMLENYLLFNEVDKDHRFTAIEKDALVSIKNKIWEQLDIVQQSLTNKAK